MREETNVGAKAVVEKLLESNGVHAFVLICEAADKYTPIIDSLTVDVDGQPVKITMLAPDLLLKVDETRKTLKREDRIVWALRQFKKAIIEEMFWIVKNEPGFFQTRNLGQPSPTQPGLERQRQKLADIDITAFAEFEGDPSEPPYTAYSVIDTINENLGHYLEVADTYGEQEPDNIIHRLIFQRQHFGEIVSLFRRGELDLLRKYTANWEPSEYRGGLGLDMNDQANVERAVANRLLADKEGPVETIIEFPNGWRWFDLHRNCSELHGPDTMGHCGNVPTKREGETVYELDQPVTLAGKKVWKPHLTFILNTHNGELGQMKGKKNNRPSPRFWKYIYELLRQRQEIKALRGGGYGDEHNFRLKYLPQHYLDGLKAERPDLFQNSAINQLPDEDLGNPAGH